MVFVWAHACIRLFFRTILAFSPFRSFSLSHFAFEYMCNECVHVLCIMINACDSLRVQIYSRCLFFRSKWARAVYVIYLLFIIKHLIKQYCMLARSVCAVWLQIHFTLIVADRKQYWPRFSVSLFLFHRHFSSCATHTHSSIMGTSFANVHL